jgi:hypothetical protein
MKTTGAGTLWKAPPSGILGFCAGVLLLLDYSPRLRAAELQRLNGHVPAAVMHLTSTGQLPGTNCLDLAIGLPLRNPVGLTNLLGQIYSRASTNYHHYLTPAQFTARFGPTTEDYNSVVAFAKASGLTVTRTHANRVLLDVRGTVTQIERALHVTLRLYPNPLAGRSFYAPDTEPSLNLNVPILHISGLENYTLPHPMSLRKTNQSHGFRGKPWAGSGPNGAFLGNDFRTAYVPNTVMTGMGEQVGLFQIESGYYQSDIVSYEKQAGLPNVPVKPVLLDGYGGGAGAANDECSLDIEMAIAMAPGLSQVLVYEGAVPDDILNQMATDDLAQQLSSSWAFEVDPTTEAIFQQFASQGQSFFNASGDTGAWVGGVLSPSDDPNITIVGGTTLSTATNGAWASETVWDPDSTNSSGGGISTQYSIPYWQQGIDMTLNQGSTTMRNIPDVALAAENVYVVFGDGTNGTFSGTSCAAPLWAGFTALVNQQAANNYTSPVGFLNPSVYSLGEQANYPNLLHDIVQGNNTNDDSDNLFYAVSGYDLCTGWGTPAGQGLIDAFVGPASPTPAYIVTQPLSQTMTVGGTVTFSVLPGGLPPFAYQWILNGTNLAGATNDSLTLDNVQVGQAGDYQVIVTNAFGSASSVSAILTVYESSPGCAPVPAGLVSWWAAEGNLNDFMGLNNGTVMGSIGYANGEVGQAFVFDGNSGYVTVPASPTLDIGSTGTGVTIECWINPSDYDVNVYGAPIVEWDSDTTDGLQIWCGGNLNANVKDSSNNPHQFESASGVLAANVWQHVALTYDITSGNACIYLNGTVVASQNFGSFTPETSFPMNIGSRTAPIIGQGDIYNGLVDEISIYNRALSSSEIQNIFVAGSSGKCFTAPVIISQPASQMAGMGGTAVFSVIADGSATMAYQWMFQGTNLAGQTSSTLTLSDIQPGQFGVYTVLVTNIFGAVLSSNAVLTVSTPAPVPSGLVSWWAAEGNANDTMGLNNGTVMGSLSYTSGEVGQAFDFDGSTSYIAVPASPTLNIGAAGTGITIEGWIQPNAFDVNVSGAPIIEWDSNTTDGLQFWSGGVLYGNLKDTYGNDHRIQTANGVLNTSSWQHVAMTYDKASGNAFIYLNGSVMVSQNFGSFTPQTTYPANIGRRMGQPIGLGDTYGGLMDELSIYNRALSPGEIQAIYVAGGGGKVLTAPVMIFQPTNQTVTTGYTAEFTALADGTAIMGYQWMFQGTNLVGATNAFLTLTNVQLSQAGNYSVQAINSFGSVLSSNAVLSVLGTPPSILDQPGNQTALLGGDPVFNVSATGAAPLSYQWIFDGTNSLIGGTNATLTLTNVQAWQAGTYSVLLTNPYGRTLSSNAVLVVRSVDHFAWGVIPSPQFVKAPFTATIQAQNITNGLVTNFAGTVNLTSTLGIPVQPSVSGAFVQGRWTGSIIVAQAATNLVLEAKDDLGDIGLAKSINVLNPPVLDGARYGNLLLLFWPTNVPGFVIETASRLNASNWIQVDSAPFEFGNTNLEIFPITGSNAFYRLLYTVP